MKYKLIWIFTLISIVSCTSQKKLAYLNNLPENYQEVFPLENPEYKIQNRDILYITLKAINPNGLIIDYLSNSGVSGTTSYFQGEGGGYLFGYNVNREGNIYLPVLGQIFVQGKTIDELRNLLQEKFDAHYKNAVVECKLLSFKFTVIGEVKLPGTYVNYNNYLTVLEAIGRAGGIGDYGRRDHILLVRADENGTKTYSLNLNDKNILSSEAYFLLPNDVVIVEQQKNKIFNMNLPTISFIISALTGVVSTTLLLINYIGK